MEPTTLEEKRKLYSLFKNIKGEQTANTLNKTQDSDVMLVDGMNAFIRGFAANPQLNSDGMHVGGIVGFLKTIGYTIKLLNPTRCVVVFDGSGGSYRRKKLFPEYKQHRENKVRLNRIFDEASTSESESQAIARQLIRTSHYINYLPVTTIQIDNVEADDVIAYLSLESFKDSNVTIMSSDKDFYQLVTDRIKIYSPTKKKVYGTREIFDEFGVNTKNFVLYRMLQGDDSDNIDGVRGCGPKTIIKCFPFLSEDKAYTVDDIFSYAEANKGKYKIYDVVLENKTLISRNYDLMQLKESIIATHSQLNIGDVLKKKNKLDRYNIVNMMREDKLWDSLPNFNLWLEETFKKLDAFVII